MNWQLDSFLPTRQQNGVWCVVAGSVCGEELKQGVLALLCVCVMMSVVDMNRSQPNIAIISLK